MAKVTKAKQEKSMEAALWESANKLRGAVEPSEYKHDGGNGKRSRSMGRYFQFRNARKNRLWRRRQIVPRARNRRPRTYGNGAARIYGLSGI